MDMTGEEHIHARRDIVWAALNDPDILKQCIYGCQSLEWTSPTELTAIVKLKIGIISASFNGQISLSKVNAPESYTISAEGKGGIAGFARGSADVILRENGDETVLQYEARAEIGGKIAQMGARLVNASSAKLAQRFFADFNAAISAKASG